MKVHYYGRLDNLESCYTYQEFETEGLSIFLQNGPMFGYEPATMIIKDPAMFIKKNDSYYRYVIEEFEVDIKEGVIKIDKNDLIGIIDNALMFI